MADYAITNVARRVVYTGSAGVGPYAFSFPVLVNTDIAVYKNTTLLTLTTDYTVTISGSTGTGSVTLVVAATGADRITIVGARAIQRSTDFVTGGDFFANTLNTELDSETIFIQQIAETAERGLKAPVTDPTSINMTLPFNTTRANKFLSFDADGNPTVNNAVGTYKGNWASGVAYIVYDIIKDTSTNNIFICLTGHTSTGSQPISSNADVAKWSLLVDAAAAATSATNAASSASAASTSATNAAASASTATTQATNASTSASNASTSATNAASSASAASTSATNAAASYDAFDDRYLGAKASAPSVDNDGNALLTGALYWNTTANQLYVWDGSAWDEAAFNATGAVTSFQTTLSGLTPSTSTTGSVTLAGTLGIANGGTGSTSTTYVNLASNVTGTLPVANGGTGATTLTANNVLLGNGTSSPGFVAPGTNGNVLTSNGTTWTSAAAGGGFPAGTRMPFQQTAAPTGWTKDTTAAINDSMLRLVTGSASSGGSTAFSTWSAVTATGAYTLATSEIPSHTHTYDRGSGSLLQQNNKGTALFTTNSSTSTGSTGGGGSHSHSLTRSLKYYDFIIASKD